MLCANEQMPTQQQIFQRCRRAARRQQRGGSEGARWYQEAWRLLDPCEPQRRPRISHIINMTAEHFGVKAHDILSYRKPAKVVLARQVAMHLARELTLHSFPTIGRNFGGREHSTVVRNCDAVDARLVNDPQLASDIAAIEREVMR